MSWQMLVPAIPYAALAVAAIVFAALLVRSRFAIYACFVGGVAYGAYHERSWIVACFAAVITLLLIVEEIYPRHPHAGTEREILHSTIYAFGKRAAGPVAALLLVASGAGSLPHSLHLADRMPLWAQAVVALLVLDFKQYWIHRLQHGVAVWWKFHRVHHYAEHLNVLAHGRTHLGELVVVQIASTLLIVRLLGLDPRAVAYGYALPGLLFAAMWAHANIDFPRRRLPFLLTLLANPNAHALHHTKHDDRRNYGEILLLWDRLFGTYRCPVAYRSELHDYGVTGHRPTHSVLTEQLLLDRDDAPEREVRRAS
jgi:sterol desaturase/sphingolipid hydroxylase (fatty acid hydroxylase superfamily)